MTMITIQNTLTCTPQQAWDCYTMPDHIIKWNFASDDWCCPSAANDMRVGGKYQARMEAKDGSFGFDFEGTYTEVEQGKSLNYVLADGRNVRVTFDADNGTTRITVMFDAENENPIDMQRAGWQAILDNYKKYTENG